MSKLMIKEDVWIYMCELSGIVENISDTEKETILSELIF